MVESLSAAVESAKVFGQYYALSVSYCVDELDTHLLFREHTDSTSISLLLLAIGTME